MKLWDKAGIWPTFLLQTILPHTPMLALSPGKVLTCLVGLRLSFLLPLHLTLGRTLILIIDWLPLFSSYVCFPSYLQHTTLGAFVSCVWFHFMSNYAILSVLSLYPDLLLPLDQVAIPFATAPAPSWANQYLQIITYSLNPVGFSGSWAKCAWSD
jgi:hypothetical protein